MPTADEYGGLSTEARLDRLRRTPGDLERAIADKTDAELCRRPGARSWAAKEIVCHLRDVEELVQIRFHTVVSRGEPPILWFGARACSLAAWRIRSARRHPW